MEAGGSNYVMYSIGEYLEDPGQEVWYRPLVLRPVIGTLHLDSLRVREQLERMYANGQRRIALVLWYDDFGLDPAAPREPVRGHIVDSGPGQLRPRHQANLEHLLRLLRCVGYEELVFRFASQGRVRPLEWEAWQEAVYRRNWSFVANTIDLIDAQVAATGLRVTYDLDVELGGIHHLGQGRRYAVRMWKDYLARYGNERSVGFSIPVAPGIVTAAIAAFDEAGARPPRYAVDLYGSEYEMLGHVARELRARGEAAKPVVVQEVFYNDPIAAAGVRRAREEFRLHIPYVLQWPLARGARQPHFSVHFPAEYDAYR